LLHVRGHTACGSRSVPSRARASLAQREGDRRRLVFRVIKDVLALGVYRNMVTVGVGGGAWHA
jgi:hypothetical protein